MQLDCWVEAYSCVALILVLFFSPEHLRTRARPDWAWWSVPSTSFYSHSVCCMRKKVSGWQGDDPRQVRQIRSGIDARGQIFRCCFYPTNSLKLEDNPSAIPYHKESLKLEKLHEAVPVRKKALRVVNTSCSSLPNISHPMMRLWHEHTFWCWCRSARTTTSK